MEENEKRWKEQTQYSDFQKALKEIEVSNIQQEYTILTGRLEEKKRELVTYSLNIGEQRMFLQSICKSVEEAIQEADSARKKTKLDAIVRSLKQKMSFTDETEQIFLQAEKVHQEFPARLNELFPELSEQERRLAILLRIGFSSKEIAPIMNISVKSVEIGRYRLRKRLALKKDENLTNFIKSI
jgi:DNA-binding NarL/FixJ family response regulator